MKKRDFDQLKEKTTEDLKELLLKVKTEALKTKMEQGQGKTKNVHGFMAKRKEIARLLTLISQKGKN